MFGFFKKKEKEEKKSSSLVDSAKELEKLRRDKLKATRDNIKLLREQQIQLELQKEIEDLQEELYGQDEDLEETSSNVNSPDDLITDVLLKAFSGSMPSPMATISESPHSQTNEIQTNPGFAPPSTNADKLIGLLNSLSEEDFNKIIKKFI
jgi:hypothetical protein